MAMLSDELRSIVIGTAGLSAAGTIALLLTVSRPPAAAGAESRHRLVILFLAGTGAQALHFIEEYSAGFERRFPELLGLSPWPAAFFVGFNVGWLVIWVASAAAVRAGSRVAWFPLWFLALTLVANGIAHPMLALWAGGYFPGLWTSPLVLVGGLLLWREAARLTRPSAGTVA